MVVAYGSTLRFCTQCATRAMWYESESWVLGGAITATAPTITTTTPTTPNSAHEPASSGARGSTAVDAPRRAKSASARTASHAMSSPGRVTRCNGLRASVMPTNVRPQRTAAATIESRHSPRRARVAITIAESATTGTITATDVIGSYPTCVQSYGRGADERCRGPTAWLVDLCVATDNTAPPRAGRRRHWRASWGIQAGNGRRASLSTTAASVSPASPGGSQGKGAGIGWV